MIRRLPFFSMFYVIHLPAGAYPVISITGGCKMTTSPYDNLPVGRDISAGTQEEHDSGSGSIPRYTEVTAASGREAGGAVTQPAADRNTGQDTAPAAPGTPEHDPAGSSENGKSQSKASQVHHSDVAAVSADEDAVSAGGVSGYSEDDGLAYVEVEIPEDDVTVTTDDTVSTDGPAAGILQEEKDDSTPALTTHSATKAKTAACMETAAGDTDGTGRTTSVKTLQSIYHSDSPSPFQPDHGSASPMDDAPRCDRIHIKNRTGVSETVIPFEETLLVPDTMPDMESVMFAECSVSTSRPQGSRCGRDDSISGTVTVYTVYRPSGSGDAPVDVIKSAIPFKSGKFGDTGDATCFIPTVTVHRCTAEMMNERKFTVRGELLLTCTEITETDLPVLSDPRDEDLVTLHRTITASSLEFETNDRTEISQEINIREGSPVPSRVLSTMIRIVENHRQVTSGRLVINGTIHTKILYTGDADGETTLCELSGKTDFTQFTAVDDRCSRDLLTVYFNSDDLTMSIAGDDRFLLEGRVHTFIQGYETREIPVICDAYHKERDIVFDRRSLPISDLTDSLSGEISSREIVELESTSRRPSKLLYGSCSPASLTATPENGRIVIEGSVHAGILALDENDQPFMIRSDIPLRGSLEMPVPPRNSDGSDDILPLTADMFADIRDFWFDEINNRQLEINVTVAMNVHVSCRRDFVYLENFAFTESDPDRRHISMALYITEHGDTLWDVARRYKTDTGTIADINGLDTGKPLVPGMKLLIVR